jgi:hypothetical protein
MTRKRSLCRDSLLIGLAIFIAAAHGPSLAADAETEELKKL